MATKEKKQPVLDVGYSDKTAVITVTDPKADDATIDSIDVKAMAPNVPQTILLMAVRYIAGYLRDAIAAATKANKDAADAVKKALSAVKDGTLQFRERGGEGGLSTEQEFSIIAGVLVALGVVENEAAALAAIQAKYDVVKEVVTPAKGTPGTEDYREAKTSETRPEYRALKRVAAVQEALNKAQKVDSVDELAALGIKKAA